MYPFAHGLGAPRFLLLLLALLRLGKSAGAQQRKAQKPRKKDVESDFHRFSLRSGK